MSRKSVPALLIVLCIFVASAGLRIASAGPQWLNEISDLVPPAHANLTEAEPATQDGDAFLEALQRRDAELNQRAAEIEARSQQLASAETALRLQINDLENAEQELRSTLSLASGAADSDIARMVSVYESMRAATAAPLFEAMDPSFAAGFLMRMEPEAAGAILSAISPERAYALSAVMAGRHGAVVAE